MQVIVELNTEKEILWSLPESNIPLTLSSPKASIETDKLNERQKIALANALVNGKIKSTTKPEEFFIKSKKMEPVITISPQEQFLKQREEDNKKLAEILNLNTGEIRKEVMKMSDLRALKFLKDTEDKGKKRATVVKALSQAIADISAAISEASIKEIAGSVAQNDPAKMTYGGVTIDYDVVEFEEDKTEVKIIIPKGE